MTAQDREVEGVEDALALVAHDRARTREPGRVPDPGRPVEAPERAGDATHTTPAREAARRRAPGGLPDGGRHRPGTREDSRRAGSGADDPGGPDRTGEPRAGAPSGAARTDGSGAAPGPGATAPHRGTPWGAARAVAVRSGREVPAVPARRVALADALGEVLAEPLTALTDLPSFDTSAMDGWAVSGPGPWAVVARGGGEQDAEAGPDHHPGHDSLLAGHGRSAPLPDGSAVRIATGARVPPDTTAVIRSEHARTDATGHLRADRPVTPGQDIRPRGQECRSGERLLSEGAPVTPAVLGLAAAAGYDELLTLPRPRVDVLVLGDELLTEGLPRDGLIRDALGPMLAPWLRALGVEVVATRRIGDDAEELHRAVTGSTADLVITTGGTAGGPVDHVHPVLRAVGAELLVDGVAVRPGHPMVLARLPSGRHLVGLPGNPLAAVSGLLTLAEPLLRVLGGRPAPPPYRAAVRDTVPGHPDDTRLVPVVHRGDGVVPLRFNGPAMLRGIAGADGLAVVPPGGARSGEELEILDLPWTVPVSEGGCFT